MIDMLKRHEIQVLRRAGHSLQDVAKLAGVSVRSVHRVDDEASVGHVDSDAERARRRMGGRRRPSRCEASSCAARDGAEAAVGGDPAPGAAGGLHGGKSALYELIHSIRPKPSALVARFEGLPGEFTQHDFGEVDVRVSGRDEEADPLLRVAPEVLALGRGHARAERAGGDAGAHAGRSLRRHRRHSAGGGLRSAEDGRAQVGTRRRGDGVESDLRRRGARSRARDRGVLAVQPQAEGRRRESGRLGEGLVLQAATLSG